MILRGYDCTLREVIEDDATKIIEIRGPGTNADGKLNAISTNPELQLSWIRDQRDKKDDYYFAILSHGLLEVEGFCGLYNFGQNSAEFGRWIVRPGSTKGLESLRLTLKFGFDVLGLNQIFCMTLKSNSRVVALHRKLGATEESIQDPGFVKQVYSSDFWHKKLNQRLSVAAIELLVRKQSQRLKYDFHHIGVACDSISNYLEHYLNMGFSIASELFEDERQGVRGLFVISPNGTRLELLEILSGSQTLTPLLRRGLHLYHTAFVTPDINSSISDLNKVGWRPISPPIVSTFFGSKICFLVDSSMKMIELIESGGEYT